MKMKYYNEWYGIDFLDHIPNHDDIDPRDAYKTRTEILSLWKIFFKKYLL